MKRRPFSSLIIGEGTLPIHCGEALLRLGHSVCGIVSPDPSLRRWAQERAIPCAEPGADLLAFCSRQPFDYLFSIMNGRLLPPEVLALPRRGAINYHDAP